MSTMEGPQVDPLDITNTSNFSGGDYELEILLGERDDARMVAAYYACWSFPELQGPYLRSDIPIAEQTIAAPTFDGILHRFTYGVAHIPECAPLLCGSYAIRWENDVTDTFGLYIPMGTLDHAAAQIGVSFFRSHRDPTIVRWWEAIDAWMVTLGRHIKAFILSPSQSH